jgi:chemotaxis protein CheC
MIQTPTSYSNKELQSLLVKMAKAGVYNAAKGMAGMVGQQLEVTEPAIRMIPLAQLPEVLGGPEQEAVGIYLRSEGNLASQFMMVIPHQKALELVDLIMDDPAGTAAHLGKMERSALAELGNITGTFFLNAVASLTQLEGRPTPPAVMVDMIGAILDILLASWDGLSDQVLMIQTSFLRDGRETEASFWVIPDRSTLEAVANMQNKEGHDHIGDPKDA